MGDAGEEAFHIVKQMFFFKVWRWNPANRGKNINACLSKHLDAYFVGCIRMDVRVRRAHATRVRMSVPFGLVALLYRLYGS